MQNAAAKKVSVSGGQRTEPGKPRFAHWLSEPVTRGFCRNALSGVAARPDIKHLQPAIGPFWGILVSPHHPHPQAATPPSLKRGAGPLRGPPCGLWGKFSFLASGPRAKHETCYDVRVSARRSRKWLRHVTLRCETLQLAQREAARLGSSAGACGARRRAKPCKRPPRPGPCALPGCRPTAFSRGVRRSTTR